MLEQGKLTFALGLSNLGIWKKKIVYKDNMKAVIMTTGLKIKNFV